MLNNKFKTFACTGLFGALLISNVFAATFNLDQGQSEIIRTKQKIDTVFVSSPSVADYEILDDHSFMIYAKEEGKSEVIAFGADGTPISSDIINVNTIINNISSSSSAAKITLPNSNLSVKKVGKAYVIDGKAESAEELEEATRIVGEASGAKKKTIDTIITRNDKDEVIPFLEKTQYDSVVTTATVDEATQINVKLTVVEVNKKLSDALGVNWSNLQGNLFKNLGNVSVSGAFSNTAGATIALINANNLNLFINALDDQQNGKILSEPNISMLSGETADILVGGEVPFTQRNKDGEISVVYKDFGIQLNVGAKIQKNNRIRLILAQSVSTIAGNYTIENANIPYFVTRRSKSTFEVADGESFVLGGLLNKTDIENISKVPVLGDIPILGSLFRSASSSRESKELVIVATVNLVKPVNSDQIIYPNFERTGTMERFFNTTSFKDVYHKTLTTNFLKNGGFIQ